MQAHDLVLVQEQAGRPGLVHGGKVAVMRSDLRRFSDGFTSTRWDGDAVRGAFVIAPPHEREIIACSVVADAGISGSDIRETRY